MLKVLRLVPLALVLAACSSVNVPLSPYRIDVQQGNALEQESVEKLKLGLTRSQVRFLLGTPLLVDPFRQNRWDYVYHYRKAGKLTEKRRLALFFDGDVLVRIEVEGFAPGGGLPQHKAAEKAPGLDQAPASAASSAAAVPQPEKAAPGEAKMAAVPSPAPATAAQAAPAGGRGMEETSVVPPLQGEEVRPAEARKPAAVVEVAPKPVALQKETNVAAIRPEAVPEFSLAASSSSQQAQIMAALNAWAAAWRARDEEAFLGAYAPSFRPAGGQSRAEWERRRRLLLGLSRDIDLQLEGVTLESMSEDRAQVSFRQSYRSDSYQDAVIKRLKFVRVGNAWLIEEENVLTAKENP